MNKSLVFFFIAFFIAAGFASTSYITDQPQKELTRTINTLNHKVGQIDAWIEQIKDLDLNEAEQIKDLESKVHKEILEYDNLVRETFQKRKELGERAFKAFVTFIEPQKRNNFIYNHYRRLPEDYNFDSEISKIEDPGHVKKELDLVKAYEKLLMLENQRIETEKYLKIQKSNQMLFQLKMIDKKIEEQRIFIVCSPNERIHNPHYVFKLGEVFHKYR